LCVCSEATLVGCRAGSDGRRSRRANNRNFPMAGWDAFGRARVFSRSRVARRQTPSGLQVTLSVASSSPKRAPWGVRPGARDGRAGPGRTGPRATRSKHAGWIRPRAPRSHLHPPLSTQKHDVLSAGVGSLAVTTYCVLKGQDPATALSITAAATVAALVADDLLFSGGRGGGGGGRPQ